MPHLAPLAATPPHPTYGSMEKLVVKAFKKWCRENVGRGEKVCGQHAAEFFFTLGANDKDAWATVHGILKKEGLI